jgi:hypothetical protein
MRLFSIIRKEECVRDSTRGDFVSYRPFYGVLPPEHEPSIHLGDVGRFTRDGEFVKLGSIFDGEASKESGVLVGFVGIPRPGGEPVQMSEEMVFDPFISRTTGWNKVPDDQIDGFVHYY